MQHRQKFRYTLLGAAILALGVVIGQFITPGSESQSSSVFDEISCRKLTIITDTGESAIVLSSDEQSNSISIADTNEKHIALSLGGDQEGAHLLVNEPGDEKGIVLSASSGHNAIGIYGQRNETTIYLSNLILGGSQSSSIAIKKNGRSQISLFSDAGFPPQANPENSITIINQYGRPQSVSD